MPVFIKLYKSRRNVIAVADEDLVGKKFEQGIRQLDVRESFYKGSLYEEKDALKILELQLREEATFNIVGKESIALAIKAGIIQKGNMTKVKGIPFALKLL